MADVAVPAPAAGAIPVDPLPAFEAGDWRARIRQFFEQAAVKRALPAIVALAVVGVVATLYLAIAQGPQRILDSDLTDAERAQVVDVLERAGIGYNVDTSTGIVTVAETDFYQARSLVATQAGIAPDGASDMLDSIPLGSSRTLEGERLRLARERELMLTIREIDGIETVRVHLATAERSAFVRENNPPSASVMVRLASGRSLSQSQVDAIVNLVAGSVPGMTADHVRVVDQNGRLLSAAREDTLDALLLQREFEAKLRQQVSELLIPLLGEGNFSAQVQVELDQSENTSARESFDPEGAIRSESEQNSRRVAGNGVGGVPGVDANTPPPDAELVDGVPQPTDQAQADPVDTESAVQRNYELDREVAVTSTRPGGLVKLSVAVAVSDAALQAAAPMTSEQLQNLVGAAVGVDEDRGDQVQVVVSAFEGTDMPAAAFYEQKWFMDVMRIVAALIAVLLVLLLAVRPLIKRMRDPEAEAKKLAQESAAKQLGVDEEGKVAAADEAGEGDEAGADLAKDDDETKASDTVEDTSEDGEQQGSDSEADTQDDAAAESFEHLPQRLELARQLAVAEPDRAVEAIQRMLEPQEELADEQEAPA